jgi:hypothetical protein
MRFEPNIGQTDPEALFLARGTDYALFLTSNGAVLSLPSAANADVTSTASTASAATASPTVLSMNLVGANPGAVATGTDELASKSNYLDNNDPSKWLTNVPNYGQVSYQNVYAGIGLTYYGDGQQLEYDFTVAPGANPATIKLAFQGTEQVSIDGQGNLVLHTAAGDVVQHAPVVYQMENGQRQTVSGGYVVGTDGQVGFHIGAYDPTRPLVIDPVLVYSTYLGQDGTNLGFAAAHAVAVDAQGNAYVTGGISTDQFPLVPAGPEPFDGEGQDVFVTKLDPSGQVIFSTYFGGQPSENGVHLDPDLLAQGIDQNIGWQFVDNVGYGIAVHDDGKGNDSIYVTGSTTLGSFANISQDIGFSPIVNAFQPDFGGGGRPDGGTNAFVAELLPDGTGFAYSSYLGGKTDSVGNAIALDAAGNAYVVGSSTSFFIDPIATQAFVARINANGKLAWDNAFGSSTYGNSTDGNAVALDKSGNLFFAGETNAPGFAVQAPVAESLGGADAYVAKLSSSDGTLLATARLGGNYPLVPDEGDDLGSGVAVDGAGDVYLVGTTFTSNFPTTPGALEPTRPPSLALATGFVSKLSGDLTKLLYSTYLGGAQGVSFVDNFGNTVPVGAGDFGHAIAVDAAGDAYVVGSTASADFPTVDALQALHSPEPHEFPTYTIAGPADAFVAELDPSGSGLYFSTYLGGSSNDVAEAVALDSVGSAYVVGTTDSTDFPTTEGAAQTSYSRPEGGILYSPFYDSNYYPGAPWPGITSAFVARLSPPLKVTALPINAYLNEPFQGAVANFNSFDPSETAADFSATINWGDKTTSDGTITRSGGAEGLFTVRGNHTYTDLGAYPISVIVHDIKRNLDASSASLVGSFGATYQADPTIVTDPSHQNKLVLVGGSEDLTGGATNLLVGTSDATSQDWSLLKLAMGTDELPQAAGIAKAAVDPDGDIFVLYATAATPSKLALIESTDGGDTFELVTDDYAKGQGEVSSYAIAAGTGPGGNGSRLWIAYVADNTLLIDGLTVSDTGQVQPDRTFQVASTNDGDPVLGDMALGADGQVAVAFQSLATDGQSKIYVAAIPFDLASTQSLSPVPVPATHIVPNMSVPPVPGGINAGVRLAWDTSDGPGKPGTLYMVYTQGDKGSPDTNIVLGSSADDGETWSSFQPVNDDVHTVGVSHFYPSLAVDPTTGDVAIGWYDARFDLLNDQQTVFETAIYDPVTEHISANVAATGFTSNAAAPDLDPVSEKNQYGDYTSVAFENGLVHLVWADNSPGLRSAQGTVPFNLANATLAVADVSVAPPVVIGKAIYITEGALVSQTIAAFTDGDTSLTSSDFVATIDWGDGTTPSTGIITPVPGAPGSFDVESTHHYALAGAYVLSITIKDTVNMLVGTTDENVSRLSGYQGQGTVTVDPKDPNDLFVVSDAESGFFAARSVDGGLTWTGRTLADGSDGLPVGESDPKTAFDTFGNLFLSYLTENGSSVVVAYSVDGGDSFQVLKQFPTTSGADRVALAVGPAANDEESVWIAYVDGNQKVYVTGADIAGFSGVGAFAQPVLVPTPATLNRFHDADLAVGPDGEVAVSYLATVDQALPSQVYVSVDPGGLNQPNFGPPVVATSSNLGGTTSIPAQATAMIDVEPHLAWDTADDAHKGRLYLVYTDAAAIDSPDTNILVRYSDDESKTWSPPVPVNDDKTPTSHFLPSIAIDPTDGDVAVAWYDTRNDPSSIATQFYASVSNNGGMRFSANVPVSDGASNATDPTLDEFSQSAQYGDYSDLVFYAGILIPAWTDNSPELGHNPDPPQFDQAVGFSPTAHVADVPLAAKPLTLAANSVLKGVAAPVDLASFTDADPGANLALYSATIDWGDRTTTTSGSIRASNGTFIVSGGHAYQAEGAFTINITIDDIGGAVAKVAIQVQVDDGALVPAGLNLLVGAGGTSSSEVAHFASSDPHAVPNDFATTVNWGDGTTTTGQIVYDGAAALTWTPDYGLLAIGNQSSGPNAGLPFLMQVGSDTQGGTNGPYPLMQLTADFHGGLAEGPDSQIYAISTNDAGESFLNLVTPAFPATSSTIRQVAYLGLGFTGGLTYDFADGVFYAIAQQNGTATLYAIDPHTFAAHSVGSLGNLSFAGLAYEPLSHFLQPPADVLYAVANDATGASTLYKISLGTTLSVTSVMALGSGFTGGLAISGNIEQFFAISGDGTGAAFLNEIHVPGSVSQLRELGAQFNNGFDVLGTHAYGTNGAWTIPVQINDVHGTTVNTHATAQSVDQPPIGLPPPRPFVAFQSFATGALTLADFTVPGGAGIATNHYTATVNWGDGSQTEPATVTLAGGQLVVTSPGHTFQTAGMSTPIVTLADDSGNTASVADQVDVLPAVTAQTKVVGLGGPVNATSGLITSAGTVTNTGGTPLKGPLYLIVQNLPSGVNLADADGALVSGQPYRLLQVSQLSPGQTASETLQFSDPSLTPFTYSVTVIDGPFGTAIPAGATPIMGSAGSGFAANVGQTDPRVQFVSQGTGYSLFLTSSEALLTLTPRKSVSEGTPPSTLADASDLSAAPAVVTLSVVGANTSVIPVGLDAVSGKTNYLFGNDPSKWQTGAVSYARVEYRDLYPGITLDYHTSASDRLEYDFTVAAGADPSLIRLAIQGAESVSIDAAGNLVLHTADGDVIEQAPVMYQQIGATRQTVSGGYVIEQDRSVGFRVGPYDASLPLVVDPVLAFSTYLGGSVSDQGNGIAVDADGNVYVTGQTASLDFPTLGGVGSPPDRLGQPRGGTVAFVTKYDPTGALVYSTYFGGSGQVIFTGNILGDYGNAIAVDAAHEAVVVGKTYSADFPLVNALSSQTFLGTSAFVAKLNATGTGFVFSTYIHGSFAGTGVALDTTGKIYVAGSAQIGLPQVDSFQTTPGAASNTGSSSFLEKLSPTGGSVLYATYVPGTEITNVSGAPGAPTLIGAGTVDALAVDTGGNAYVTGVVYDERYQNPAAPPPSGPALHAAQSTFGGGELDAFVAKLNTTGTALDYWTYLGGNDNDVGNAIAVDSAGSAYVAGTTMSTNLPAVNAAQSKFGGIGLDANNVSNLRAQGLVAGDAFAAKLSPDGSSFVYLTYLGGSGPDVGTGIAVDAAHNAYITGQAGSADFPTVHAVQPTFGGDQAAQTEVPYNYGPLGEGDAFLARINASGGTLDYSTFVGGSGTDRGNAVAVTPGGEAFATGLTTSSDFPTFNAAQPQTELPHKLFSEASTAFVAGVDPQGSGVIHVTNVAFAPTESVAFNGAVASFTDSDTDTAANYSATIDWADGTTSVGTITSNNSQGSGFNVSGTHTYAEDGKFPVVVTVHDTDGSIGSATAPTEGIGPAHYHLTIDTSSLVGKSGFLDFQFNPGALPSSQAADVIVSQFQDGGGSLGGATLAGGASGSLAGTAHLINSSVLNELKQALTYGSPLSFDVTLEGDALNVPLDGLFGSLLSLTLLAADGVTPLQATAADGTALEVGVSPTGNVALIGPGNNPSVHVAAVNTISVADAPLQATLVPIQAVEGITFGGTVATFIDPNAAAMVSDFTTSILWGDGTAASTGTLVADGGGRFHVTGSHTFTEAGNYSIQVIVLDKGGSQTIATAATGAPSAQITGLQAPRSAYEGGSFSLATGDLTGNGKLDLVAGAYVPGTLQTELLVLLGNGDGSFQSPLHLAIPASDTLNAFSPVIADFNGDGKPDIAVAGLVFLGNGDGTFQPGVPFDAGTLPIAAQAAGDFNGDGKLDLVVAGGAGAGGSTVGVRVLMGSGDGTFKSAVSYGAETSQTVSRLFVGNFHGNGKPDIVFSTTAGDTWILPNLGGGTFGTATLIASGLSVAAVGDLKGNGELDLVATDGTPLSPGTHVAVLMGNGDGTFQPPVSYRAGLSLVLAAVGDFSGDGKLDIAVADEGTSVEGVTIGSAIRLLRNNGDGTFAAPVSYATQPAELGNLVTGDFNGDGNLDLAMENNSSGLNGQPASISILLGRGDGTFADGPFTPTGNFVNSIATADFHGDGHTDVALTGGVPGVEVLAGNGDGTYESARVFATPDASQIGSNLLSADFNGDGHPDLVTGTLLFAGNGDGSYQPATTWNAVGGKAIATGDFTGDGHSDLVSYSYNNTNDTTAVFLWLNDGHGSFHSSWSYTITGDADPPAVADFSGDGKPDLAIAVQDKSEVLVFLNNGDGTFKSPLTNTVASGYLRAAAVGDFRGNGKEDLAVAAEGGVYVLLGNGDGTFQPAVNVDPMPGVPYSISTGDFTQDGNADLLLTTQPQTSEVVTVLISNGDGTFHTGQTIDTALNSVSGAIVADFTGDGKLDFAVAGLAVHLYLGNGDGTFQAGPVYATANLTGEALLTLAAADVTGNGRVDLLTMATGFGASGATFGVLLGQPDGTLHAGRVYGSPGELATRLGPQAIDLNHDGKPDIVAIETTPSGSQDALVLLNNGDDTFTAKDYDFRTAAQQQQGLQALVGAFVVGDFTGDGIPDIVADVSGMRVLLVGNGDGTFQGPRDLPLVNSYNPTIMQAVDVNGDGKLDLVTFGEIPSNRQVFVQVELGDGKGGFQTPVVTGPLPNVDLFSIASSAANAFALGDFNGDGKLDVAVGKTDGSVEVLLGNGDGTFQAPVSSPLGMPATQFVAGDLYGDGKTELVAVDSAGVVAVLRGNSDGTFQQPLRYSTSLTAGQLISDDNFVSLADVNGDGVPDVVIGAANGIAAIINQRSLATTENVADAALTAAGRNNRAVQGATFFGSVAHFNDANPQGAASDFAATITWGDGTHSAATVETDPGGGFDVLGTHVYTSAGTLNVSVAIADEDGSTAAASSTMAISASPDATLSASGATSGATSGVAFSGLVATFTDGDPAGTVGDFTALIDWGDGHKSLGVVQSGTSGGYQVSGMHTYAQAGTYQVTVSIFDSGGATATAASTADVAANNNSPLAAAGVTVQAVEQAVFGGIVATFTDSSPGHQTTDYTAIVDWGDGQTSAGAITADAQVSGQFDVLATHTYAEEGVYAVTLQISRSGASVTASSTSDVADASLVASGSPISAIEATAFNGLVATFSDANPFGTLADYSATIDWGDGHTSTGRVSADPAGFNRFDVTGTNTYAEAGQYIVTLTVTDRGGGTESVRLPASVADAPITAMGTTVSATMGVAFSGIAATFRDQNIASTAADFAATIVWGDGHSTTGSVAPAAGGGFEVSGTHTYSSAGTLPVTVSILDEGGGIGRATATAVVAGPTVQATAAAIQATEGLAFAGAVATFSVAAGGTRDFAAAINWGNGQTTAGTITYDAGTNQFDVLGSMIYAEEGSYTVGETIGDRDGTTASLTSTAVVADASLNATAMPVAATKGVAFSGFVAHFTDANPLAQPGDFTAQIIWGDGQTTTGTIGGDPTVAGQFDVTGSVTYQTSGSLPLTVTVSDAGGASAAATATATVEILPTASGTTLQEQATVTFSAAVAVIDDPNPSDQPGDFAATIAWGDGQTSAGLVTYDPTDRTHFRVLGNSAYASAGTYTLSISLARSDGLMLNVTDTASVSAAPDTPLTTLPAIVVGATQGVALKAVVGMFSDADPAAAPSDYSATINWGDGSSSAGSVVALGTPGAFAVVGQHTYASSGTDFLKVNIDDGGGANVQAGNEVQIAPSAGVETISGAGLNVSGREFSALTNVELATFTITDGSPDPGALNATINWGDGTTSVGGISLSAATYTVTGAHTYGDEGNYTITVSVAENNASPAVSATITSQATIHEQLLAEGNAGTPDQNYIQEIYHDLFGRLAEPQGRDYWVAELTQGVPRGEVAYNMVKVASFEEFQHDTVAALYQQYLGRAPDAGGLVYWSAYLYDGGTIEGMSQVLVSSPEYFQVRGAGTVQGFLEATFRDALGRQIDPAALTYFEGLMSKGASAADMAAAIFSSDEYHRVRVNSLFEQLLDRPADPGALAYFAGELDSGDRDEVVISQLISSDEYYEHAQI